MKNIIILIFLFILPIYCWSQTTTFQVVTKTIEETNTWNPKQTLEINGENAIIHISTWDQDKIQTTIELIAKHPEKETAEKDIEVLQYNITNQRKRITINNFLSITKENEKPASTLKTKMTLLVPPNCPLAIKNNFGSIHIEGCQQRLEIESRFSKISLEQIKGSLKVNSHLGELIGKEVVANTTITSNRSKIFFEQLAGEVKINSKYGTVQIVENPTYAYTLNVKGDKSDVSILNANAALNRYALSTSFGTIATPSLASFDILNDSDTLKQVQTVSGIANPNVQIALTYGDILIE